MFKLTLFAPLLSLLSAPIGTVAQSNNRPEATTLHQTCWAVLHAAGAAAPVTGAFLPSTLGAGSANNYCQAATNSSGGAAGITHVGSLVLSDNTFGLMVTGAPVNMGSFGAFTYGSQPFNTTFGNGYLCISPFPPGVHKMPAQRLGNGTVSRTMDQHPADFVPFTPSSTWNFQFWYRDLPAGGARFNLSDGLHVTFAP